MTVSKLRLWPADPREPERVRLNRERWASLTDGLRVAEQAAGRGYVSCGATHGVMERCDFGCTSCYLSDMANATPPLSFAEVCKQLDELRSVLGPAGKTQITSGEVTLLPVHDLGRIVRYARRIGLDPMVMTHGQRFAEEPDYLAPRTRSRSPATTSRTSRTRCSWGSASESGARRA